jgi:hypothetical protein
MPHVIVDVNAIKFQNFFDRQVGEGQYFYEGIPYQRGWGHRQRGAGLSTVLSSIWKFIQPAVRNLGQDLSKESLAAGARALSSLSEGSNIKDVLKEQVKEGARNVLSKSSERYLRQKGSGKRKIIGRAYPHPNKRKTRFDALGPL